MSEPALAPADAAARAAELRAVLTAANEAYHERDAPEMTAIVDMACAVIRQPQDDGEQRAVESTRLHAADDGELVADVMILLIGQFIVERMRRPRDHFRLILFVAAQHDEEEKDENDQRRTEDGER